MRQVSHRALRPTVGEALQAATRRLARARVHFGHGTDNARDDAAVLLWHALDLDFDVPLAQIQRRRLSAAQLEAFETLLARRIVLREPAVYLTGMTLFAGIPIRIDRRALVPRSPLAELVERGFAPWIDARRVHRVLDLGTGSGCIAIACARFLPRARVDATDVSGEALSLARENVRRLRLTRRVELLASDHFAALRDRHYDIIVSNPPYVGERELRGLPAEYRHEPRLALAAGRDGLASVHHILAGAARHLTPGGILVVEVGNTEILVRRRWPRLPFIWLEFERGGGGVFLLTREQLLAHATRQTVGPEGRRKRRGAAVGTKK
ncbi:MAG: 50S ribosomal protein L3 N(5)-glutamine methyltransferase [Sinobacteraceae bacterium]|nr:50S ribosomal protein L3 N(5)-glutamine methyltransferase [Nevskiaceae bacterium]